MSVAVVELSSTDCKVSGQLDASFETDFKETTKLLSDHKSNRVVAEVVHVAPAVSQVEGLFEAGVSQQNGPDHFLPGYYVALSIGSLDILFNLNHVGEGIVQLNDHMSIGVTGF